ncbi:MAG: glycoside hydrolase family 9 protein [Ruminococcus sp.]|nr:glycoside hydrolase family 9 protein [Ruminococcus sp.]
MKSNLKKTLAVISALCLSSSMMLTPMSASAGQMLGQLDFNEGIGLPWHICESATASMTFELNGENYQITIVNPGGLSRGGEDRWDCQFRHRGLKIRANCQYRVQFDLTASQSGRFYTKIGNLNGDVEIWHNGNTSSSDFEQYWELINVTAGQTYHMDCTFTPTQDVDVAEWTFQFGGDGQYTSGDCFPAGTVLTFDNMSLENLTSDEDDWVDEIPQEFNNISLNQVGYYANRTKKATIVSDTGNLPFEVVDESGTVVYSGTTGEAKADADSGNTVTIADFSEVRTAGTYTVKCNGSESYSFEVFDSDGGVYQEMTKDALNYFFLNRGNQNTTAEYISGGYADSSVLNTRNQPIYSSVEEHTEALTITGSAVRTTDIAYIADEWKDNYLFDGSDVPTNNGTIDVTGGWYDAGDYGKYVVNGGISVWTLQNIYERAMVNGTTDKWADNNTDIMYIPESGNGYPDILDEAAVELDWFINCMQRDDGMVYHKTHDYKWTALATLPSQDVGPDGKTQLIRIVKPVTYAATLNLAATGAQGYRVWKDIDATRAQGYLDAAVKAYNAAKALYDTGATELDGNSLYAPMDQSVGGGPYGDTEVRDDFYWAACELYAATGDETYKTDLEGYSQAYEVVSSLEGGENSGSFSSFNWGCTGSLGSISLALNSTGNVDDEAVQKCQDSIVSTADVYIAKEDEQGYGIPYQQATYADGDTTVTGYEWGSNSFVVNNAIVMGYAYDITGDGKYVDGVTTAMDYILGRNPMENSYVTGYGSHYTKYVHHRYWSYLLDTTFPLAPAGVLSGGPNSAMQDPYIKGAGYKVGTLAPQLCYLDHIEAWSANECTINWNSPLAWVVSFMEDEYDAPIADSSSSSSIKLDKTSVTVEEGETATVSATTGTVTQWSSSDDSVATVVDGVITGVKEGTATITATDADGNTATVKVTVTSGTATTTSTTEDPGDTSTTTTTTSATDPSDTSTTTSTSTSTTDDPDSDILWGDVNVDGSVKSNDLLLLKKYLLGLDAEIPAQGLINADVTHDDDVKSNDLLLLKKYLLGLVDDLGPTE